MKSWLSNGWLHNPLAAPVLLVAVIFAVYYPAMLSGIHPVDDPGIFALYSASPPCLIFCFQVTAITIAR